MIDFMRSLLSPALKDNLSLGKAFITGITRVAKESLFSGVNNLYVWTMLGKRYAKYFGFTEDEVLSLLPAPKSIEQIRQWYNGYTIGECKVYNPWSIINCLYNDMELKPYWVNTSENSLVYSLMNN